jgi:hypothetical protein
MPQSGLSPRARTPGISARNIGLYRSGAAGVDSSRACPLRSIPDDDPGVIRFLHHPVVVKTGDLDAE